MSSFETSLILTIKTGNIKFGVKESITSIKKNHAKFLILSKNCSNSFLLESNIPRHIFEGHNMELGILCKKPFSISAIVIIDFGESKIEDFLK